MKKLLLLFAAMLMSAVSFAQTFTATWTKPLPAAVDQYQYSTFAADFQGDTIAYYLYNVGASAFFTEGNAWGTQASIGNTGLKVAISKYTINDVWDEKTVFINDFSLSKNSWKLLFIDSETQAYVDHNNQANFYWEIVPQGNKNFRIKGADENPDYNSFNGEMWFGMSSEPDPATAISPRIDLAADPNASVDWQFIPEAAYDEYQEKVAPYLAAMHLKEMIEWAMEQGVKAADLAECFAVYNNTNSTVEQLNAAADVAYKKGRFAEIAPYFEHIVQGEKNDVSGVITNNDFSDGTVNGWDITYTANSNEATNIGYQSNSVYSNGDISLNQFIEAWKNTSSPNYLGDGSITQTIPELPAGKYMLAVDVIANNQGRTSDANNPDGLPDDVELFAEASADGKTYKTDMATRNGVPEHFEFTFIHTGGDMKLGLRVIGSAEAKMPANWIAMDNLMLYYYGEVTVDPDKALLDMAIDNALKAYPLDQLDQLVACQQDKDAFKAAIEAAQAATENYVEHLEKVNAALKQLNASVDAYKNFVKKIEDWNQKAITYTFDSDEWYAFCDFVSSVESPEGYPELTPDEVLETVSLTIEELNAYIEQVDKLFNKAFSASLVDGTDLTMMLKNADLFQGRTGWTTSSTGGNFQAGGYNGYKVFEAWHATNFNFSQQLEDLPIGVYELSTQGYVRYLDGQDAINRADERPAVIPIYIYMNDSKTNFPNWLDYKQEPGFFTNFNTEVLDATGDTSEKASFLSDSEGYEYCDNRTGAAATFAKGDYTVRTFGLVANEGETFTVGVKGDVTEAVFWPLWGQFKLTYRAFNPDVVLEALETALASIDTSKHMAKSLFAKATELKNAAEAAKTAGDGKQMFDVLKDIYALTESINESVILFEKLQTAAEDLITLASESGSASSKDAMNLAGKILNDIEDNNLENADAESYLEQIAKMKTILRLPDNYKDATDEAPVDVTSIIETPSFEKDGTNSIYGWTATGQKFGNSDQLSALALESWESVFHIYQDIVGLPDGIYTLKVNGWQRTATPTYLYGESGGELYIKELIKQAEGLPEDMTAPSTLTGAVSQFSEDVFMNSLVVKVGDEKLRIGVRKDETSGSDWIVLDNFMLFYHGANSSLEPDKDAIADVTNGMAMKVETYTLDGRRAGMSQKGILIQKITMSDGTILVRKVRK